ncbi:MAG: hypothetical protein R3D26_06755 [Cyanobacteriota/Melainabacteria group bacterium]
MILSATVANAQDLTITWINETHGATELVSSDFRPVPLEFHFFVNASHPRSITTAPLSTDS